MSVLGVCVLLSSVGSAEGERMLAALMEAIADRAIALLQPASSAENDGLGRRLSAKPQAGVQREEETAEKIGATSELGCSLLFPFAVLFRGRGPMAPRSGASRVGAAGSLPPRALD